MDGADDKLLDSLRWAERMERLGLLREDQVLEAAALRAAALGATVLSLELAVLRRPSRRLPRHKGMRAMQGRREKVRRRSRPAADESAA